MLQRVWKSGWSEQSPLDPDYLWKMGSRGYGKADEVSVRDGEDIVDFRDRLIGLCAALNEEADLTALGHAMAFGQLRNAIRRRFALGRWWRNYPDMAHTAIAPPIIVVGQMRSGTTRVQRLLAADPAHSGTRFCDSMDPVPQIPYLRPLKAKAALALARRINPWLDTMHPFGAVRTDEEIGWLSAALSPAAFEAQWHISSYVARNLSRDKGPVYREFARILRTDAAHHGSAERPRVLKCPQYAEDLADLLTAFPDARIVRCSREPRDVLASSVSMVASQMAFQNHALCEASLEDYWQRRIAFREERMDADLAAHRGPVALMSFDELNADWRAAIVNAYRTLGVRMTDTAMQAMEQEASRARNDLHHAHRHQVERLAST